MSYKITINAQGGRQNHIANPLFRRINESTEFATREEACEAIYNALYDVIDGEGCEMVDRSTAEWRAEQMGEGRDAGIDLDAYCSACHDHILREGYATEDGVSATVEEVEPEIVAVINAHPELHAEMINGLVEVTPSSGDPITEPIEDFVRRIAGNEPFEMATVIDRDNENNRISFEVTEA